MRIKVCDGKYEFVLENLRLSILRYGEPWLNNHIQGERSIIGLMEKYQELHRDGKDFEKLFAESVNPTTEKVTLSYSFLKALRERHAGDQKRIAELEDALKKAKDTLGYAASVCGTDGNCPIDKAKQHAESVLRNVL